MKSELLNRGGVLFTMKVLIRIFCFLSICIIVPSISYGTENKESMYKIDLKGAVEKFEKFKEEMGGDVQFGSESEFIKQMIILYNDKCNLNCTKYCVSLYSLIPFKDQLDKRCLIDKPDPN